MTVLQPLLCPTVVGRDEELAALDRHLCLAAGGRGSVVLLGGEPGIGKSRLCRATMDMAGEAGFRLLHGVCFQHERSLAYGPIVDALQTAGLASQLPGEFAAVIGGGPPAEGAAAEHEKRRLFEQLFRLLHDLARESPLLLVLEDLHWSDPTTLEFAHLLARRIGALPILLLATYRTTEVDAVPSLRSWLAELERERMALALRLERLTSPGVAEMVGAIFATRAPDPALVETLESGSEGNPFFVEELLRALADERRISGDGVLVVGGDVRLPQTVRDVILQRLEALDEDAWLTVSAAAAMGRRFDVRVLAAAVPLDEERLLAALRSLVRHQLVEEETEPRGDFFQFRHALTRDAVYDRLIGPERRRLHRVIAEAMEKAYAGQERDRHLAEFVHHWEQANDPERTLAFSLRAAWAADRVYAWGEAVEFYQRALKYWPADDLVTRASLHFHIGLNDYNIARFDEARDALTAAASLATRARELRLQGEAERRLGRVHWILGDRAGSVEHYQQALELLEQVPEGVERAWAYASMAQISMLGGQWTETFEWGQRAVDLAERLGAVAVKASALNSIGSAAQFQGDAEKGVALLEESLRLAIDADAAEEIFRAYNNLLDGHVQDGWPRRPFEELLERGVAHTNRLGNRSHECHLRILGALAMVWYGDWARARSLRDDILLLEGEISAINAEDAAICDERLALLSGHWEQVLVEFAHIRPVVDRRHELQITAPTRSCAAAALRLLGRWSEAEATLAPALALAREHPELFHGPEVFLEHLRHLLRRGERAAAEALGDHMRSLTPRPAPMTAGRLLLAEGLLARDAGQIEQAADFFEKAAAAWDAVDHVVPAALARLEIALACRGRRSAALRARGSLALERARSVFEPLGSQYVDRLLEADGLPAPGPDPLAALTAREREVIAALGEGASNLQIAERFVLSERTVERHLSNIYAKLGLEGRAAAIALAARLK